ncbi:hypothetical protein D3C78_993390 [compost metagenome]
MEFRSQRQVSAVGLLELVVHVQDLLVELEGRLIILVHLAFHTDRCRRVPIGILVIHLYVNHASTRSYVGEAVIDVIHFLQSTHGHFHGSQQRIIRSCCKQQTIRTHDVADIRPRFIQPWVFRVRVQIQEHVFRTCRLGVLLEAFCYEIGANVVCHNHAVLNYPWHCHVSYLEFATQVVVTVFVMVRGTCHHRPCRNTSPGIKLGCHVFVELVLETKVLVLAVEPRNDQYPDL